MSRSRTIGFPLRRWCMLLVVAGAIGLAVVAHAGLVGQLLAGSWSAPVLVLTAIAFVVKTALIVVHRKNARREEQA